ncbi:GNAT family N-acetyltransferase [Maribacter sp. 2307ULW6-5]|uniref:GNAT family N-acetyltransferase n=1 Tax=Maribacter sp. 2307ULW6-5 TaxID=3386275 RepID=UPI0039BC57C0
MQDLQVRDNPFKSATFQRLWCKHFAKSPTHKDAVTLCGVPFIKKNRLPIYENVGRTQTKGMDFETLGTDDGHLGHSAFLLYDVPGYFKAPAHLLENQIGHYKVKQYPGYLIELDSYQDLDKFMLRFSKRTRYKLRKCHKRLNLAFDIEHHVYFGEMDPETHNAMFKSFKGLLEKRFCEKNEHNNNLEDQEWNFFKDVSLPLIREKKAALSVLSNSGQPIAITLNFCGDGILYDAITVFDIDYQKFSLGYVNNMYIVDWCLKSNFKILDFSKGFFEYKEQWASLKYDFFHYVFYNRKSTLSKSTAYALKCFYAAKQWLRDHNVHRQLNKIRYRFKKMDKGARVSVHEYELVPLESTEIPASWEPIPDHARDYGHLKGTLFSFLYLNEVHVSATKLYAGPKSNEYYLAGPNQVFQLLAPGPKD